MTELHVYSEQAKNGAAQPDQCPSCRAPVAHDQRYCLNCGARQPSARVPIPAPGKPADEATAGGTAPSQPPVRDWTPVIALGGLAALALVLVIGVLIGRSGQSTPKVAAGPQVITVNGGASTPSPSSSAATTSSAASAPAATISDDWPSGKSAWTVQLQTVSQGGATSASVNAAKSAASSKGAPSVGVLNGSKYNSLGSDYIIYSGVYSSQAAATTALAKLKKSFPSAKVLHVVPSGGSGGGAVTAGSPVSSAQQQAGSQAISSLNNCQGSACSKVKAPSQIATPGKAPPKDNKPAGGGGGGQTFQ
jgi:hypothetical protein